MLHGEIGRILSEELHREQLVCSGDMHGSRQAQSLTLSQELPRVPSEGVCLPPRHLLGSGSEAISIRGHCLPHLPRLPTCKVG